MAAVIIFCAIMPVNDQQSFKRFGNLIVFLWVFQIVEGFRSAGN